MFSLFVGNLLLHLVIWCCYGSSFPNQQENKTVALYNGIFYGLNGHKLKCKGAKYKCKQLSNETHILTNENIR